MRETEEEQQQGSAIAPPQPAPVAPGKQTLVEQSEGSAAPGGDSAGALGKSLRPAPGQRAGDWGMTAELAGAMGLSADGADGSAGPSTPAASAAPSGRHEKTDFGEYWVIPDDSDPRQCIFDSKGEIVAEKEFTTAAKVWKGVQDGTGRVKIVETDLLKKETAGFKAMILTKIAMLMTKSTGRSLLLGLAAGGYDVTIRPSRKKINGGGQATRGSEGSLEKKGGEAGLGSTTMIEIDPTCSDTDNLVHDKDGNEIADPVFIFLGHELIHARHNQAGRNRTNQTAKNSKYTNAEEEQTIAAGDGMSENLLRAEHGLTARAGHSGRDVRF